MQVQARNRPSFFMEMDLILGRSVASVLSMTTTDIHTQIPVRLDFDRTPPVSACDGPPRPGRAQGARRVRFDPRLRELVRIRASQLNGCAYCIDMHTKDARAIGETEQRIYTLPAWRETPFFTGRERAALAFAER